VRLKRGLYAKASVPGLLDPHVFELAMRLVAAPSAISGTSALNHHGFTEQIPIRVTLTTPSR
jgi:predicted transcriptional regulator of viral defense system